MKNFRRSLVGTAAAVAIAISASAQQPTTSNQPQNQGMQMGQSHQGNMNKMMDRCRTTMQSMMQTNERAKRDIDAARASNDAAKMKSALGEAEQAIDQMNDHMSTCMSMMNMMQNMHGMGSGMMGGQQGTHSQQPQR